MSKTSRVEDGKAELIHDFLASAHVFAAAVADEVEEALLRGTGGRGVTPSQMKLLKLVSLGESQTIGSVAAFLDVSAAAASKAVDRLVRKGLLVRKEGAADRRFIHLALTDAGRRRLEAFELARRRKLLEMFGDFAEEELRKASSLLDRLSLRVAERAEGSEDVCLKCGIYFRRDCLVRRLEGRRCLYLQMTQPDARMRSGPGNRREPARRTAG
jgi:DNA-binding MarR family transcriptional regulator